jgi:hypothetical protein
MAAMAKADQVTAARSLDQIEADLRSARLGLERLRDRWLAHMRAEAADQEAVVRRLEEEWDACVAALAAGRAAQAEQQGRV